MERNGLLSLQAMMFLLIGAGVFLKKKNIITGEGRKVLTDLIVDIILPCNIIGAFYTAFDKEMLISGLQILMVSLALQLFCMLISGFCYKRVPKSQRVILQYGTVCSNAGFLGNPVAEGLYGSLGLLYASIYLIPHLFAHWFLNLDVQKMTAAAVMMTAVFLAQASLLWLWGRRRRREGRGSV